MDFSPHHEAGGVLHLPSPTHPTHSPRLDSFASLRQLRRSLSRSPSKSSRFSLHRSPAKTPNSPLSPLVTSRGLNARPVSVADPLDLALSLPSPLAEQPMPVSAKKSKLQLRRSSTLIRSSPRTRQSPKSPRRRPFGDITNSGGGTPSSSSSSRRSSGEENETTTPRDSPVLQPDSISKPSPFRFELNDGPIRFDFPDVMKPKPDSGAPGANVLQPIAKSSPLKRSDGVMNLDQSSFGSPVAKRRSLHAGVFASDFNIFDHYAAFSTPEPTRAQDQDQDMANSPFSSLAPRKTSPPRKSFSLRKSTLQQRHHQTPIRPRGSIEHFSQPEFAVPSIPASKKPQRMSLDSALPSFDSTPQPYARHSSSMIETFSFGPIPHRPSPVQNHRHPLANAHSAFSPSSSSTAGPMDDRVAEMPPPTPAPALRAIRRDFPKLPFGLSNSLPVGAMRPAAPADATRDGADAAFATPQGYKMAKPLPAAFMSTGLISKKNRNAEPPAEGSVASYAMPDTPSKRNSFPPASPKPERRAPVTKGPFVRTDFGATASPFSTYPGASSPEAFHKSSNIFGANRFSTGSLVRRSSFLSTDGEDNATSPSKVESQSSNDDLPPTPTKPAGASGRHSKENSLRSSLFGRRTSLGPDTFLPPSSADSTSPSHIRTASPSESQERSGRSSPHTPQEKYMPPDPSGLSISAHNERRTSFFNSSLASFPPATPTAPRDMAPFGKASVVGVTQNDVDTVITSRFSTVTLYGTGEFSQVFRVEKPLSQEMFLLSSPSRHSVWAVKKTKKQFQGNRDRERQLVEVDILKSLRGHDHVINYVDSWEANNRLYIQTEFCENGNLKDFLTQAGYKARLDDFRIWKILLELTLGVKFIHDAGFIHLDLKPANAFIDWEGVLKIGDFGLASRWPAPKGIEGEGDREYIGPEILAGRFDKPADIFALGMIMVEIAGNIVLPDNGLIWQRFRAGNLSDVPSLTWSSESSLLRNESGEPIDSPAPTGPNVTFFDTDGDDDSFGHAGRLTPRIRRPSELVKPPSFMVDPENDQALDKLVHWMINPNPDSRPTVDQLYHCGGVQWVEQRRRAGATIYEGNWGPSDDVLNHGREHGNDIAMTDV